MLQIDFTWCVFSFYSLRTGEDVIEVSCFGHPVAVAFGHTVHNNTLVPGEKTWLLLRAVASPLNKLKKNN